MNGPRLLVVLLLAILAVAATAEPWQASVDAPRALPDVEVTLGYPTGFVSATSSPIRLRIRTGERRFDGSVGFHIAAGTRRTLDPSIVTPVGLAPRSEQVFETWAQLRLNDASATLNNRELIIEWRDASMRLLARKSAGIPPWQHPQPLRLPIAAPLSTAPQWYAGFSRIETPTAHWFSLPLAVREAIFRSAIPVVFAGAPETVPSMTAVDRALLPVEFRAEAGTVAIPWPYRTAGTQTLQTPVSWTADEGADVIGDRALPYIAANRMAIFTAEARAIDEGLPSFRRSWYRRSSMMNNPAWPAVSDVFREWQPLLIAIALMAVSIATWVMMRRRPRPLVIALVALSGAALVFAREAVQLLPRRGDARVVRIIEPGVVEVRHTVRETGVAPLHAGVIDAASVVTPYFGPQSIEARRSTDLPASGVLHTERPWTSRMREVQRRELGRAVSIRVQPNGNELAIEYESPERVDIIDASWICGESRCFGSARAGASAGRVVMQNADEVWPCFECRLESMEWDMGSHFTGSAFVSLVSRTPTGLVSVSQVDPPGSPEIGLPFTGIAPVDGKDNVFRAVFAIPPLPADGSITAKIDFDGERMPDDVVRLIVAGKGGTSEVIPKGGIVPVANVDDFRAIAADGGIVVVTFETATPAENVDAVRSRLSVRKKS